MEDGQTLNGVPLEYGLSPGVHIARLMLSMSDGRVVLKWLVETRDPPRDVETFDAQSEVAVSAVDATGEVSRISEHPSDADLLTAATLRLKWDLAVPLLAVRVAVDKGAITLTGEVEWQGERLAAERDVIGLPGVVAVFNRITLRGEGCEGVVCDRIGHAADPAWRFEPTVIQFQD